MKEENSMENSIDNRKIGSKDLVTALVATVIILAISRILTNTVLGTVKDEVYEVFYSKLIMAGLVIIAVLILRKMRIHLFSFPLLRGGLLTGLYFVLLAIFRLLVAQNTATDTGTRMLVFILAMLLVGYTEEALFRGLIQNAFHKIFGEASWQAVWIACICTGILFGAIHLTNVFKSEISTSAVIVQAVTNVFVGVYFCAMYYRTGKCLWYVTIVHAFNDFCAFLGTGFLAGGSMEASISGMALPLDAMVKALPVMAALYLLPAFIVLRPNKVKPLLGKKII